MGILDRVKKTKKADKPEAEAPKKAAKKVKAPAKKAEVKKETKKKNEVSAEALAKANAVLLGPVVTEKTAYQSDRGVIVFRVAIDATRVDVRNAVHALYQVTPKKVNIMNMRGKRKRFGRVIGKRRDWKKAMVILPEGKRIDLFEGV